MIGACVLMGKTAPGNYVKPRGFDPGLVVCKNS